VRDFLMSQRKRQLSDGGDQQQGQQQGRRGG
jgi:hypothetical protein